MVTFHELSSQLPPSFHCSFVVFHLVSRPTSGLSVLYLPAFSSLQPTSWHWVSGRGCLTLGLLQPCGLFEILHVSTKCFMGSKTSAEAGSEGNPEGHNPCCWVSLLSPCLCSSPHASAANQFLSMWVSPLEAPSATSNWPTKTFLFNK